MRIVSVPTALLTVLLSPAASAQISEFCFGDGTATACPCANSSALGANEGCLNHLGLGGRLRATGSPSVGSDSLVLLGSQMTPNFYAYFQGTAAQNGGMGVLFGDGLRCVGGAQIRLNWPPRLNDAAGASFYPDPSLSDPSISVRGLVTTPGTRYYQCYYRDAHPTFCTSWTWTTTNGVEVIWGP